MVVNSFILFMDFKDKILVSIFFFTSSYNDVCGKCMHNMHFFITDWENHILIKCLFIPLSHCWQIRRCVIHGQGPVH